MSETVVVVSGGEAPHPRAALVIPGDAPVIVADRGLDHALALGLKPMLAVGDFDSASPEAIAVAEAGGTRIVRHAPEKDATDLELALDAAIAMSPARIVVLAGDAGRLDHALSVLLLLASARYASAEIDAFVGAALVHVVRGGRVLDGTPRELLSLLPVHGQAEGVTTEGLTYALRGETLEAGSSRGVSNMFETDAARIDIERGVLLAIRPSWSDDR